MTSGNLQGAFFRPQKSFSFKIREFCFFLASKNMLIFYTSTIAVALVVFSPILVSNYIGHDANILSSGSCRLKTGFMIDCSPEDISINEATCLVKGCCFKSVNRGSEAPLCHRQIPSARSYNVSEKGNIFPNKANAADELNPPVAESLVYRIASLSPGHLVVRLCKRKGEGLCRNEKDESSLEDSNLIVSLSPNQKGRFEMSVSRPGPWNSTLFDSSKGAIIIGTRLTEISTLLSSPFIYGLGGHETSFSSSTAANFTVKSLMSSNLIKAPQRTSIKSFMGIDEHKGFYGLVMESQTPGEAELLPGMSEERPLLVFRSMGGEISFHFFSGPKPSDVMNQMALVLGAPLLPPKWMIGIHLCRENGDVFKEGLVGNELPYDSDCLDRKLFKSGFSLGYPSTEVKEKVSELRNTLKKKFILTNPLPVDPTSPYIYGMKLIQDNRNKETLIGNYKNLRKVAIPDVVDDGNEWQNALSELLKDSFDPDALHISDNAPDLSFQYAKTSCKVYFHHKELWGSFEKSLCHLYSFGYHPSSSKSHSDHRDDYPRLTLQRSSSTIKNLISDFASLGIQRHGWIFSAGFEKEVRSEWDLLMIDLKSTLEYGLAGIALRSMSPCTINELGMIRDEDACYRWFLLGAYMPAINTLHVSPLSFKSGKYKRWLRNALQSRYRLHPYYYSTLAHASGQPLIRPLFYEFPMDTKTYALSHRHLMIGDSLLLLPVTSQSEHENEMLSAYFPRGTWYDIGSGAVTHGNDQMIQVMCFKFHMPIYLRKGKIIPTLDGSDTSVESSYANHNYALIIGMDCDFSPAAVLSGSEAPIKVCSAAGAMYLEKNKSLGFVAKRNKDGGSIHIKVPSSKWSECESSRSIIGLVIVYGLTDPMDKLILSTGETIPVEDAGEGDVNGRAIYNKDYNSLVAKKLNLDFCNSTDDLIISWDFIKSKSP